ncbi:MAG TPA: hypothetical protein VE871_02910 [Longimicrobium sp.]|nr:hypothetical protein [Longimicrobium sp.]
MCKLKLDVEMLTVHTFAALDGATTLSTYRAGRADPNTDFCSVYPSFCAMECASDTIDRSNGCHRR